MDYMDNGRRVSLRLSEDVIDKTGLAIFHDTTTTSSHLSNDDTNPDIAPWLDIPPTPPPKSPSTRHHPQHKSSFGGLSVLKPSGRGSRSIAPSDSLFVPSDSKRRSADDGESSRTLAYSGSSTHSGDLRKAKSSMGLNIFKGLKKHTSKSHLRSDSEESERHASERHASLRPPVPALPIKVFNTPSTGSIARPTLSSSGANEDDRSLYTPGSSFSATSSKEKEKEREREREREKEREKEKEKEREKEKEKERKEKPEKGKKKTLNLGFGGLLGGQSSKYPPSPPLPKAGRGRNTSLETYGRVPGDAGQDYTGDLNLDDLEGIVDFRAISAGSAGLAIQRDRQNSATGDTSTLYTLSYPHHYSASHSRVAQSDFSDPWFSPSATPLQDKRRAAFIQEDGRKISPKTLLPPYTTGPRGSYTDYTNFPMSGSSSMSSTLGEGSDSPKAVSWVPPESWLPMDAGIPSVQTTLPEEDEDGISTEDERPNTGRGENEELVSSDTEGEFEGRKGSNTTIAQESYLGSGKPKKRRKTEGDVDGDKTTASSSVMSLASSTKRKYNLPFVGSMPQSRKSGSRPSAPSLSSTTLMAVPSLRSRTTSNANSIFTTTTANASTTVLDLSDRKSVFEGVAQGPIRVTGPRSNENAPGPIAPYPGYASSVRVKTAGTGKYHLVTIGVDSTVHQFRSKLHKKYKPENPHVHHDLYLTEQGRERILQPDEQPAQIVRNRLTQAGYDFEDGVHLLQPHALGILFKFVYKSQDLSGEELVSSEDWKSVDLSGRGLRTIPVALYQHAEAIISLKLSRNPITEIPKDFIQSCTRLRELKLSNMAIKKVPHSVQYSPTLHRLDISCNNIKDLDEPLLDKVTELRFLNAQNNRLEKLPWYLPRLENLVMLNISNNKFTLFPSVVTLLVGLKELDISFNMIREIPEAIGNLLHLDRLVVVSNQIVTFPEECSRLINLRTLDCRRNQISDLSSVCNIPMLNTLNADYNLIHGFALSLGPSLATFTLSHNDITLPSIVSNSINKVTYPLTFLDLSYAQLSTLDQIAAGFLPALRSLNVSHNKIRTLSENLVNLQWLEILICTDNKIDRLPETIGNMPKLAVLDAHNNCLSDLPQSIWNCRSLTKINFTSNSIENWPDPPLVSMQEVSDMADLEPLDGSSADGLAVPTDIPRKTSTASILAGRNLPPLVHSLRNLCLGENNLTDNAIQPLAIFYQLRVLNLAYNEIQDLPPHFFRNMVHLEELYLSGNKLTNLPAEDLPRLSKLTTLFLNGNRLQTLPQELTKVAALATLDAGSNILRYNINNYEFDWNWNFNKNLKYLNLSGNSRLHVKPEHERSGGIRTSRHIHHPSHMSQFPRLSGFTDLTQLHVLGLMDVTITTKSNDPHSNDIPDENPDRRVRTSNSTIGGMGYGIADSMGKNDHLSMLDLVHEFHGRKGEAIFAMFGRVHPMKVQSAQASPNLITKFLHDNFMDVFTEQMAAVNDKQEREGVPMHVRRDGIPKGLHWAFLKLNQDLHDALKPPKRKNSQASIMSVYGRWDTMLQKGGASGVAIYIVEKMLYAANVGDSLAVVSRQGVSQQISKRHDPFDLEEIARIRAAEGYVTPSGLVNNEVDVSRSFGYYHMFPPINARAEIFVYQLTELDEFVIIANRGLWDFVPFQTAVDIARSVPNRDAMFAAQKLRDLAISYGSDGTTMVMVVSVADLHMAPKIRQPTLDPILELRPRVKRDNDHEFRRLGEEVPAPTGHITLVFTDIRNSTHLWEANPGIQAALRTHNHLLRRQLRFCGGYEVKTEGDSFMCSFPTALAGLWWCLTVQLQLLSAEWPLEILECEDGKPVEENGVLLARGLSVRMGIHCGQPLLCEPDPITKRMDYFGPMVNRSARIMGSAQGGQILCSLDVMREINARINDIPEEETEYSKHQSSQSVDAIKTLGIETITVGETKLKGLELPELLTAIYPKGLKGRCNLKESSAMNGTRVQFSVPQMRELGILCLRVEALASGRVFQIPTDRKESIQSQPEGDKQDGEEEESKFFISDPDLLLPSINDKSSDYELNIVLDSLSIRIENAVHRLSERHNVSMPEPEPASTGPNGLQILTALQDDGELDQKTLDYLSSIIRRFEVLA